MIKVVISEKQESFFKEHLPSVTMQSAEEPGKLFFCLHTPDFQAFYKEVQSLGLKPGNLMTWQKNKRSGQCSKPPISLQAANKYYKIPPEPIPQSLETAPATT